MDATSKIEKKYLINTWLGTARMVKDINPKSSIELFGFIMLFIVSTISFTNAQNIRKSDLNVSTNYGIPVNNYQAVSGIEGFPGIETRCRNYLMERFTLGVGTKFIKLVSASPYSGLGLYRINVYAANLHTGYTVYNTKKIKGEAMLEYGGMLVNHRILLYNSPGLFHKDKVYKQFYEKGGFIASGVSILFQSNKRQSIEIGVNYYLFFAKIKSNNTLITVISQNSLLTIKLGFTFWLGKID